MVSTVHFALCQATLTSDRTVSVFVGQSRKKKQAKWSWLWDSLYSFLSPSISIHLDVCFKTLIHWTPLLKVYLTFVLNAITIMMLLSRQAVHTVEFKKMSFQGYGLRLIYISQPLVPFAFLVLQSFELIMPQWYVLCNYNLQYNV